MIVAMTGTAIAPQYCEGTVADIAAIVAERNLSPLFLDDASAHSIKQELQKLSHVRLDREHIASLEPALFLYLPNLTNLYLQQNQLKTLRALEEAQHLQFLTVAGNQISVLEGLQSLPKLMFLDASNNCIDHINAEQELPKSLSFLNVLDNPCCLSQKRLHRILESTLPDLKELNGVALTNNEEEFDDKEDDDEGKLDEVSLTDHGRDNASGIACTNFKGGFNGVTFTNNKLAAQDSATVVDNSHQDANRTLNPSSEDLEEPTNDLHGTEASEFQKAWESAHDNAFVAALQKTLTKPLSTALFRENPLIVSDEISKGVGEVGADKDKEFKRFLGLYVDDDIHDRGSVVKSILVSTCEKLQQDVDKILHRSQCRVLEDEKALKDLQEQCTSTSKPFPSPRDVLTTTARFVLLGSTARNTGAIHVYELEGSKLKKLKESEKHNSFKCGTFGASTLAERHLATGDFKGNLFVWDLEKLSLPVWHLKAHDTIVNAIDGCGGLNIGYGAPEIVTGGRDGRVRVWDPRQKGDPVASFEPKKGDSTAARDCWTVAFGNSYNDEERCVLAGYDNGDVKMFDLRTGKVRWETTLPNGVCGIDFDRKDIKMNKFVCTTLEAKLHLYDLRTYHPEKGYASLAEKLKHGTTVWGVKHLPQNREVFVTLGGDGSLSLYKYSYPEQRTLKDEDKKEYGVAGTVQLLSNQTLATQPISCFNWSPDKQGLAVCGSFDQCLRTIVVTKLHKT